MIDIDQMQSMLEANVSTMKDMKENPGKHLEELPSHMETNGCEHKGTKVEDFNLAQKKIVSMKARTISLTTSLHK